MTCLVFACGVFYGQFNGLDAFRPGGMGDGIDVMHGTVFSGYGAVVGDRDAHLCKSLMKPHILLFHHILISGGQKYRRASVFFYSFGKVENALGKFLFRIEVNAGELFSRVLGSTADRTCAFACHLIRKIRDAEIFSCIFRMKEDRGQMA